MTPEERAAHVVGRATYAICADGDALAALIAAAIREAVDAEMAALRAEREVLLDAMLERDQWVNTWARGMDENGIACWCGAAEDHVAPANDDEHATACAELRRLIGPWDGRQDDATIREQIRQRAVARSANGATPSGAKPAP